MIKHNVWFDYAQCKQYCVYTSFYFVEHCTTSSIRGGIEEMCPNKFRDENISSALEFLENSLKSLENSSEFLKKSSVFLENSSKIPWSLPQEFLEYWPLFSTNTYIASEFDTICYIYLCLHRQFQFSLSSLSRNRAMRIASCCIVVNCIK